MKKEQILDVYFQTNENYTTRIEQHMGKDHVVVPVTMMTEGVRSGSHGPILHLAEELGSFPESWDGIPVTIRHPQVNGIYVSANSPDVLSDWATGQIFNAAMDGVKLNAEAWCCLEDLERVSEDTLEMLNNNEIIEVSIGVYSDEEDTQGTWEGVNYNAIARNYRPNHLALLPDEIGACSIEDGCGIRVNKKGEIKVAKEKLILNAENQSQILKELNQKGFSVNEIGYSELGEKVRQVVYGLDGNGLDNYVVEVYEDYFVYQQFNSRVEPRSQKLYKQGYQVDEANNVTLSGESIRVKREISYEAVPEVINTNKGRVKTKRIKQKIQVMAECTDCVKKLADGLIANTSTAWAEDDREYLEAQSEDQLEKMTPQEVQANTEKVAEPVKVTRAEVLQALSSEKLTKEEFMSIAPDEVASQLSEGQEIAANQKKELVTDIMANSEEWTEDELNAKEVKELQKVYKVVNKGVAFNLGSGGLGGNTKVKVNEGSKSKTVMLPNIAKEKKS